MNPVCRTPQEAFEAGLNARCRHGVARQPECRDCRLTEAEIGALVVLLKGMRERRTQRSESAA